MIKLIIQDDNLNKNKQRWLHRKLNSLNGSSVNVVTTLPEPSAEIENRLYALLNGDTVTLNMVVKRGDDYVWENLSSSAGIDNVVVTVDDTSGNPQGTATFENGLLTISFTGIKGLQGDKGDPGEPGAKGDTGTTAPAERGRTTLPTTTTTSPSASPSAAASTTASRSC